jgi:hypothetical protein
MVWMVTTLWLGALFQAYQVSQASSTLYLYNQPQVCALTMSTTAMPTTEADSMVTSTSQTTTTDSGNILSILSRRSSLQLTQLQVASQSPSPLITMHTLPSATVAQSTPDTLIAHCGDCGQCSNPHDIALYDTTKHTLLPDSKACAHTALFLGRERGRQCLHDRVGFTEGCNDCWMDNIMCDVRKCAFVCLWHTLVTSTSVGGGSSSNSKELGTESQALNPCTLCDEVRCGPAFVQCAGANRRRSGILSELQRDSSTVCKVVDHEWWKTPTVQSAWVAQTAVTKQEDRISEAPKGQRYLRSL